MNQELECTDYQFDRRSFIVSSQLYFGERVRHFLFVDKKNATIRIGAG